MVPDWLTLSFTGLPYFTGISTVYQGFSDKSDRIIACIDAARLRKILTLAHRGDCFAMNHSEGEDLMQVAQLSSDETR
jgi:hypothetical protein